MSAPVVTPEARQAATMWARKNGRSMQAANIARGSCDTAPIVQAFASFERRIRTQAEAASKAREDALVEALEDIRTQAHNRIIDGDQMGGRAWRIGLADILAEAERILAARKDGAA